jgi:WD40 repeat protein
MSSVRTSLAIVVASTLGCLLAMPAKAKSRGAKPATGQPEPVVEGIDRDLLLVSKPGEINGVQTWTVETRRFRAGLNTLAFSSDSRRLAVAGDAGTIRILETDTGKLQKILVGHRGSIRALAFLPDGKTLASVSRDRTVRFWEAATGKFLRKMSIAPGVYAAAFSPDAAYLATVGADGDARLWDVSTGRTLGILKGHTKDVETVAWSPDGKWIATGAADAKTMVWSASTRKQIAAIDRGLKRVGAVSWSPDSGTLAFTGGSDGALFLWDLTTKETVRSIKRDVYRSGIAAWSPDGRELACQGESGKAYIWDTKSWQHTREFISWATYSSGDVSGAAWSPDGQHLAVCSSMHGNARLQVQLSVCVAASGKALWKHLDFLPVMKLATMSADGRRLACSYWGGGFSFHLWDLTSATLKATVPRLSDSQYLAWSPDGEVLAACEKGGGISLWDAECQGRLRECVFGNAEHADKQAIGLTWSPDGKRLISGAEGEEPSIFNSATGKELGRLKGHRARGRYVLAWSPTGKMIALGFAGERNVILWSAATGRLLGEFKGPGGDQRGLAWSPNSRDLVCGGTDGKCVVWRRGRPGVLPGTTGCPIKAVAWSPDGKTIAAGEGDSPMNGRASVLLWSAVRGRPLPPLGAHSAGIHSLGWSRDGKLLLSACERVARLWDFPGRRPLTTILPTGPSSGVAIGGSGHFRASGEFDPAKDLVYVAVTADGQETFTPAEFQRELGWRNDPAKVGR